MGITVVQAANLTDAAEARRVATGLAARLGFPKDREGRVALVATEAATNAVRHGGGGEVLVGEVVSGGRAGVEIIALDKGSGMPDVERSMQDGYSTAGSAGTGLGAIRRLSSECAIYSAPGKGTAVLARIFASDAPPGRETGDLDIGGVAVPVRGEALCGDGWAAGPDPCGAILMVSDGLGHGPAAADASRAAESTFRQYHRELAPAELMHRIHGALRSTRGAAVALARLCTDTRQVRFLGVGNISGAVIGRSGIKQMVSHPGTVGLEMHRVQEFTYEYPGDALVVLHSDGIVTNWSLDGYPRIGEQRATLIAAILYRDFQRPRDDSTVVVARPRAGGSGA